MSRGNVCRANFLIVKIDRYGERIPLTVCDYDREKGTIAIVFQVVGSSSARMAKLEVGDCFEDVVGPLGRPSELTHKTAEELQKMNISLLSPAARHGTGLSAGQVAQGAGRRCGCCAGSEDQGFGDTRRGDACPGRRSSLRHHR